MRALSIRQPHAEAILLGVKTREHRGRETRIRGRFYIYASLGRYSEDEEARLCDQYGISQLDANWLRRGAIVGTAELVDCDGGDWLLRDPRRIVPRIPDRHPQPVWFFPFEEDRE